MAKRSVMRVKGLIAADAGIYIGGDVLLFRNAGVPVNGTSGTGVGKAGNGSLCSDYTNGKLYINTGTMASPTWTVVGTQS